MTYNRFRLVRQVTAAAIASLVLIHPSIAAATGGLAFPMYGDNDQICGDQTTTLAGNSNKEKAFNFFVVNHGLKPYQAAGIVGNLSEESGGVNPKSHETDNAAVGRGIAQWSAGGRWEQLKAWVAPRDPWTIEAQLDYLWYELTSVDPWKQALPAVQATADIQDATYQFMVKFEKPDMSLAHPDTRLAEANDILKRYGGGAPAGATPSPTENCGDGTLGSIPSGTAQELANQLIHDPNISFQTPLDAQLFDSVTKDGTQVVPDGPYSTCGKRVTISPRLLGVLLAASKKYKIVIGVFATGHDCDQYNHPKGLAVDLNAVNPLTGGSGTGDGKRINPGTKNNNTDVASVGEWGDWDKPILQSFYVDVAQLLSSSGPSAGMGQIGCFPPNLRPAKVAKVTFFNDTCHHLHVDVGSY